MLLDYAHGHRVVAIIGLTKNTGKTTTFNHLVRQATERERTQGSPLPLGLTSIGRNGERWDAITRERKPLIWAPTAVWLATTEVALNKSRARLSHPSVVMGSPFGPILLGRVAVPGYVELIGPQTSAGVSAVTRRLREAGAELILVDGTFGRRFTADAGLSDGLIIATGATAGNTLQAVVERTCSVANLYRLPPAPESLQHRAAIALQATCVTLLTADGAGVSLPFHTALGRAPEIVEIIRTGRYADAPLPPVEALVLPGALTNSVATELSAAGVGSLAIIVTDPSCLLLDGAHARRLSNRGISLYALHVTPLLAVTINPYKCSDQRLPADELRDALARALAPVPVVNVADEGAVLAGAQPDGLF